MDQQKKEFLTKKFNEFTDISTEVQKASSGKPLPTMDAALFYIRLIKVLESIYDEGFAQGTSVKFKIDN